MEQIDKAHNEWFKLICESIDNNLVRNKGNILPGFPDAETQINSVGAVGKSNLIEAYIFFQDVVKHFSSSPNWKSDDKVILDFGCGWGRIARFFLLYFKPENILGIDIDEELLNVCRNTFNGSKFYKCLAFPPTTFENDSIDFIVGYSVFSHLSEMACHQWMEEFKRILKTGGTVALTSRGRPFFDYCISLKGTNKSGYLEALSRLFDDFDTAKKKYDAGEFVHSNVKGITGGGVREAEFYGESFIPERYASDVLSKYLTFLAFSFDSQRSIHPTIYFKKE
jgi:ubiquinone/menaquinone biosynthesis C-methylase UbiE